MPGTGQQGGVEAHRPRGATSEASATPWVYCHWMDSGLRKSRSAARLAGLGSCQYFWMGFQAVTEALLVGVAILGNDGGDTIRMMEGQAQADRRGRNQRCRLRNA